MVGYLLTREKLSGSALHWVGAEHHSTAPTLHGKQVVQVQAQYRLASSPSSSNGRLLRSQMSTILHRFYHPTHRREALSPCRHLHSQPARHTRLASAMGGMIRQILRVGSRLFRAAPIRMLGVPSVYLYRRPVEVSITLLSLPMPS